MQLSKITISPFPIVRVFLIVYILMNVIGIINFPIYIREINNNKVWVLFILGLISFWFFSLLFRLIKLRIKKREINLKKHHLIRQLFIIINLVMTASILYTNIKNGQIIIFSESDRFKIFAITNLFVFSSIIITLVYFATLLLEDKKVRLKHILFIIFQCLLFLSLGFRSPIISLLGGVFVVFYSIRNNHQNRFKKIFSLKIILGGLAFIVLMSSIATFRVSRKYDVTKFYRNIDKNVLEENRYLTPFIPSIALFRHDQENVDKLIEEKEGNPMYFKLIWANISTLLPGSQWATRNYIGDIVGARKKADGTPWSITPTLQGVLFVDGGYSFVIVGFMLTALCLELVRKYMKKTNNPFTIALYGLLTVAMLKCIHTGYLDIPFFIILSILFILKFFVYHVRYNIKR